MDVDSPVPYEMEARSSVAPHLQSDRNTGDVDMTNETLPRRTFLRAVGLGTAGTLIGAPSLLGQPRRVAANDRIGLAIIGVGSLGGGNHHLGSVLRMPDIDVVAVADVDRQYLDKAVAKTDGKASAYKDFRHVLDRKDVDAVIIATPDHWHALTSIAACEAGKDVYCEKPLSLNIEEGRAMVEAARRYGRVFQVGCQQRSDRRFRRACELVRNGHIGRLTNVEVVLGPGPEAEWEAPEAAPAHLDWNMWLGPAPWREYHQKRCHYQFRWFFDYSGGKMTDWGAHHLDIAQWGIGVEHSGPVEIQASALFPADNFYETPKDFDVHYTYAGGVRVHCTGEGANGVTFKGTGGEIFVDRSKITADPAEILEVEPGSGKISLPISRNHHRNWIDCMRSRRRPVADVEIGHRSATVCHLGNIAIRTGRRIRWDPTSERILNDEGAVRLTQKPMRRPWSL
jgi:predicted dehydrogenase